MTDAANAEGILSPAEIENAVEDSDQPEEGVTTEATAENTTEEAQEHDRRTKLIPEFKSWSSKTNTCLNRLIKFNNRWINFQSCRTTILIRVSISKLSSSTTRS